MTSAAWVFQALLIMARAQLQSEDAEASKVMRAAVQFVCSSDLRPPKLKPKPKPKPKPDQTTVRPASPWPIWHSSSDSFCGWLTNHNGGEGW